MVPMPALLVVNVAVVGDEVTEAFGIDVMAIVEEEERLPLDDA